MNGNPYRYEIVATAVLVPGLLALETWRRWGELLSPRALDDWLIGLSALIVVVGLARRAPAARRWWLFVCGGAWFLFGLSLWGSIHGYAEGDPSAFPMPAVIAFKASGFALISVASWRALRLLQEAGKKGLE